MTYDADLNLIVCAHATSSLIRERPDGRREVLASHFDKQELNSPNDVCVRSDGSIYFSDPWSGRMPVFGVERPRQLVGRLSRAPEWGAPQLLVDRYLFDQPNGLCFSPDEKRLYVNDTVQTLIRVFDIAADGSLSNGRIFASGIRSSLEPGVPDGMKCDARGDVWVTGPGGVWVYASSGDLIGKLRVPEKVANLAWGGEDFRTLFMTATHSVYTVATKVGPRNEPYMNARGRVAPSATGGAERAASSAQSLTLESPALRHDHPGYAERRHHRGRRFCSLWRAGARAFATRRRERTPPCRRGARARRDDHSCLVRGRAGRSRRDAERAAVRGRRRQQGDGARRLGRGARCGARAAGRRSDRREDTDERLGGHKARDAAEERQARHDHQHRRLDQHVGRAHRQNRRRQGLFHDRAGGLLFDDERRLAQRLYQLRAAERFGRHER